MAIMMPQADSAVLSRRAEIVAALRAGSRFAPV